MDRRPRQRALLTIVGIGLLIGGCGLLSLDEKSGQVRSLIQKNKEDWEGNDIESYQFAYDKTIGSTSRNSVRVIVRGGQIDTVMTEETDFEDVDSYLTISRLYDEIVRNFERDDRGQFTVQFNDTLSYPSRYQMQPGDATEGRGVVVENFEVLSDDE